MDSYEAEPVPSHVQQALYGTADEIDAMVVDDCYSSYFCVQENFGIFSDFSDRSAETAPHLSMQ